MPSFASSVSITAAWIAGMASSAMASPAWMYFSAASFMARSPRGPLRAMRRAISSARSTCWPAGTTSCTRPICSARSAPNSSHSMRWYMALPQPVRVRKRKCAPPRGAMPRRDSIWQKRALSAAITMSAASIISMPTVRQSPCTAATTGFMVRRFSAKGSTLSAGLSRRSRLGPKNFGMSSPAVVCSPAKARTATHSSSLRSNAVKASDSSLIMAGVKAFRLATLSTTILKMRPSVSVRIVPGWTVSGMMFLRGGRRWRKVGAQGVLVGGPRGDAGDVVGANGRHGHAVVDRPDEAGREQHVGAGEALADEVGPPVAEGVDDVAQLGLEVLAGALDGDRRFAVDVLQVAVAAHDVEAGRVELHGDVEAPF